MNELLAVARAHLLERRWNAAVAPLKDALRLEPESAIAYKMLAHAFVRLKRWREAIACHQQVLCLEPDCLETYVALGVAYREIHAYEQALHIFEHVADSYPDRIDYSLEAASLAVSAGAITRGKDIYRGLTSRFPDSAKPWDGLSHCASVEGDAETCAHLAAEALKRDPACITAWYKLFSFRDATPGDPAFQSLEEMRARASVSSNCAKGSDVIGYTLGKMYEDVGNYNLAFDSYQWANNLQRERYVSDGRAFSADRLDKRLRRLQQLFSVKDAFTFTENEADCGTTPIFILGMPRSGTTLVEQIVSTEQSVHAGGELMLFGALIREALSGHQPDSSLRDMRSELAKVRKVYLQKLKVVGDGARYVTDKTPANFEYIGFIKLLFPGVPVILCRRSPMDVCASIFTNAFNDDHIYATDLTWLGDYYLWYCKIMQLWLEEHRVKLLQLDYERLVSNLPEEVERLCAYIGISSTSEMLSPERNRRPVHTLSLAQVRKPVNQHSVGRWQRFTGLKPLYTRLSSENVL